MIDEVAATGADYIKFQMYKPGFVQQEKIHTPEDYSTFSHPKYIIIGDHARAEELNNIALKEEDIRYLYYRCCNAGIEFLCTPFYPEAVDVLNPYVKRWKVRYIDRFNIDLLSKIYETGKEVLISCDEPPTTQDAWEKRDRHAKYLYCISEYPPKKGHDLINNYKGFDGASCHYPTIEDALDFVRLGADILEVHCMRDSYNDDSFEPIDCKVSLRMSELKELVRRIRSEDY